MNTWRDSILKEFVPEVSNLTLVADPDGLMTEEKLMLSLRERGFSLIEYNDHIEFRYVYESKYRSLWDRGERTDLVVILRMQNSEPDSLPYDLLQVGRKLSFNLGGLFPNLSYPVVEKLDRGFLDTLFEAQDKFQPDRMGDNATMDFILMHVFGLAAGLINSETELLRALLRLHYGKLQLPHVIAQRLIDVFQGQFEPKAWPLDVLITDGEAFFSFLQERWPLFLGLPGCGLKYPGPELLPFGHQDIIVYMDNLFLEGRLKPVELPDENALNPSLAAFSFGIKTADDKELRVSRLFELTEKELPETESRYSDWISFAMKWAELSSLVHSCNISEHKSRLMELSEEIDGRFAKWLKSHYAGLINLPPSNPVMLHHVARYLARSLEGSDKKRVALLLVDGLALEQWITMKKLLKAQDDSLLMRESALFAWIPTLTSVSRQALFAGKPPLYFPSSINSTNSEEKLWVQFWEGYGVSRQDVAYRRGLGDGDPASLLEDTIHHRTRAAGLIIDKVDRIMHGMQLGAAGMHNQVGQWCGDGFILNLINKLLDYEFDVCLTSDHGNIECNGMGRPSEGAIAETRGERVRIYPSPELRTVVASNRTAEEWQPVGLPENYYPLLARGRDAFLSIGESVVGHGGAAIEEVIVPLVKFERSVR